MPNPGPASTVTTHLLLQADSSDGYQIGSLSTTPVGLYGVAPVAQRTNANQTAVSQAAVSGTLLSINTVGLSPAGTGISQCQTQAITMTSAPLQASDFLIVNKPTSQAGLGICGSLVSATGVATINFCNLTAATITATAGEAYSVIALRGLASTISITPASVAANTTSEQTFTVNGLAPGMLCDVQPQLAELNIGIVNTRVVSNNLLGITFMNVSAAAITPKAQTYSYIGLNGLNANSNLMLLGANVGTLAVLNTVVTQTFTIVEQAITVSSILATDVYLGTSKPTLQNQVAIMGGRISAANTLNLSFGTGSITGVTPTASEVYSTAIYRQAPVAPMTLLSQAQTPASVAANTTAEQAFTVSGVLVNTTIWGNKPSATVGLGIVGYRVSAANVIGVTFSNNTATAITPPAETYLFGMFQPVPNSGSYWDMQVNTGVNALTNLANELRTTLVNLGPILGL